MTDRFVDRLAAAVELNKSLLCVGLDPDPSLMPVDDVFDFNRAIIDATKGSVCAYKPNLAFYEALGRRGLDALEQTISYVHAEAPGIVVVGDAKRGDIASTNVQHARALFKVWGFDAATVNGYAGGEAMEPFLEYEDKAIFVWCRSSNPGASELQDVEVDADGTTGRLYELVAERAAEWNRRGNVGLVVGATYPEELRHVRELCPDMPILIPGIGAQLGGLEQAVAFGADSAGRNAMFNASRGVMYASPDASGFGRAAGSEAEALRKRINWELEVQGKPLDQFIPSAT